MAQRLETRDGVALVEHGDTLVALWRAPASADRWRQLVSRMELLAASRPNGIVCLDLLLEGSSPPDGSLRRQMQSDLQRVGPKLRRFVVVPLGGTLWLSIVCAMTRAVLLLAGQSRRLRVVTTVDEGLREVHAVASAETPSADELRRMLTGLFAALGVNVPEAAA